MIKFERLTRDQYEKCSYNMNVEMNLSIFEELNYQLEACNGAYEDTDPDRVVSPLLDCHKEYFYDKQEFIILLAPRLIEKLQPTNVNEHDRIELQKIVEGLSAAQNMVKLVWVAEQLLAAFKTLKSKT